MWALLHLDFFVDLKRRASCAWCFLVLSMGFRPGVPGEGTAATTGGRLLLVLNRSLVFWSKTRKQILPLHRSSWKLHVCLKSLEDSHQTPFQQAVYTSGKQQQDTETDFRCLNQGRGATRGCVL